MLLSCLLFCYFYSFFFSRESIFIYQSPSVNQTNVMRKFIVPFILSIMYLRSLLKKKTVKVFWSSAEGERPGEGLPAGVGGR